MAWHLKEKRVLITGGTKGIGFATAEECLALGASVVIVARNADDIAKTVAEWQKKGFDADGIAADIASETDRAQVMAFLDKKWGGALDVLVNNVGMNIRKTLVEYTVAEYRQIFETNLFSVVEMCRLCFPLLKNGQKPSVVNVASVAGLVDVQSGAPYGMTKAAEIQLTRHLAAEWATEGVRVNAVSPWYTVTPLAAPVLNQPERVEKILSRTPLQRIAEAEEVAALIAFLAMDKASYITGQNIAVDGGFLIKGL